MKHLLSLCGLALTLVSAQAKLNVVATTPDLGALATEVGGNLVTVTTLAKPTEDPHFVDAKPSFIVKLNRADVLIEGGADLEAGWLPSLLAGARNVKLAAGAPGRVRCSEGVRMLEVPATLDRSAGDIHAAGNPHFLVDPENAGIVAQHLAESFGAIDPANREMYLANAKKFTAALNEKIKQWQATLAPFKGEQLVAYHNSWIYFANRFGLKIDIFLEPKPGIPPSPAHMAEVISKTKAAGVRAIIVDPYLNRKSAETVARSTGATVVDVAQFPGGMKGTDAGYIELIDYVVNAIAKALATPAH